MGQAAELGRRRRSSADAKCSSSSSDLNVQRYRAYKPPVGAPSHVGRQVIDERACPWSRRQPRAFRGEILAALRFAMPGPQMDNARFSQPAHRPFRTAAPARFGALADARRCGRRRRTRHGRRKAGYRFRHAFSRARFGGRAANGSTLPRFDPVREAGRGTDTGFSHRLTRGHLPLRRARALGRRGFPSHDPARKLESEPITRSSHRRAHRHPPLRSARALRRVRR